MPSFKRVPDEPGFWVRVFVGPFTGEFAPDELDEFRQTDEGLRSFIRCTGSAREFKHIVWYGPLPSTLPEGWEDE